MDKDKKLFVRLTSYKFEKLQYFADHREVNTFRAFFSAADFGNGVFITAVEAFIHIIKIVVVNLMNAILPIHPFFI